MFDQAVGCVFLVEDSKHDIAIFEYAARRMHFPITLRKHMSGTSALAEINTLHLLDRAQLPALFILDIAIPDVNGVELCKRIKEVYAARGMETPAIVFLTSHPTDEALKLSLTSPHIEVHEKPTRLSDYQNIFQAMFSLTLNTGGQGFEPMAASA